MRREPFERKGRGTVCVAAKPKVSYGSNAGERSSTREATTDALPWLI